MQGRLGVLAIGRPGRAEPWTDAVWFYDYRTNIHHTLKKKPLREEIFKRDKTSLDIFWLRDQSLGDLDNLPEPDEIAEEIIENLEAGLESFRGVLSELQTER